MASFKQRGKNWFFIIDVGIDLVTGRRRQKTVSKDAQGRPFETERDARKAALKMEQDIERGKKFESITLQEFMVQFFEKVVSEKVEEVTYDNQWQAAKDYVIPYLGHMMIDKITDIHIENLYDKLLKQGVQKGTIRNVGIVLSKTFKHANKKRLIMDNPMKLVTTPTYKPKKQNVWSPEQVDDFLESSKGSKFHNLYIVAESSGMRRGELLGLHKTDVNLDAAKITINKAVKYSRKSKKHLKGTKTENSRRTIEIPQYAVAALREQMKSQMEGVDIVFDNFGSYYLPNELSRTFGLDCKKSGLPPITFHGLRHAHATHLLSVGFSVAQVAERLGDTKETIMKTYAHVLPISQGQIAASLDKRKNVNNSDSED